MISLVLGGARSGKSRYAETLCDEWLRNHPTSKRLYIATAQSFDEEMDERIKLHQARRKDNWQTIEEPFELPSVLKQHNLENHIILVDCLTLWLSNLLLRGDDMDEAVHQLLKVLEQAQNRLILVSNEVGLGIVPDNKLGRQFRDIQGIANQKIAEVSDDVFFLAAGLPLKMKG